MSGSRYLKAKSSSGVFIWRYRAAGQRRVDFSSVEGDAPLLVRRLKIEGAHVVQPVRQFDDNHAGIFSHRQEHLSYVFSLKLGPVGALTPILALRLLNCPDKMPVPDLTELRARLRRSRHRVANFTFEVCEAGPVSSMVSCRRTATTEVTSRRSLVR